MAAASTRRGGSGWLGGVGAVSMGVTAERCTSSPASYASTCIRVRVWVNLTLAITLAVALARLIGEHLHEVPRQPTRYPNPSPNPSPNLHEVRAAGGEAREHAHRLSTAAAQHLN